MAAKKGRTKPEPILPAPLRRGLAWLAGPGRPWFYLAVILAVFFGGWRAAWQLVRPQVLGHPKYRLAWQNVELPPQPEWVHVDVRAEVFRDANLDDPQRPLSLLDADLAERIGKAFSLHPWVAQVQRVEKTATGVRVELTYRRPVCMVEVRGELIPIDAEGTVLPGDDFSSVEFSRYPRLAGIDSRPLGAVGTRWGDPRVAGGAEVAGALLEKWEAMNLARIEPVKVASAREEDLTYELWTRRQTRIAWGHSPSHTPAGEPAAADKTARLERYLAEHGTLEGPTAPQRLDLTRPGSIEIH